MAGNWTAMKIEAKYSGHLSEDFWEQVHKIKNKKERNLIYLAGCALQDHETRVIQMFESLSK